MNSRWKMNRIGFVNFWLYDEEEFWFENGRLLLRGQNGSGKSITTQSFIPFILDGDRTPNRLDPFGSSDRRMEYYFLGEEGRDEATGYLYLEFKREDEEAYRTIGIGQRAKRGRPMDFWGFLLLDGRRIGYDLQLYKETGSVKIPYDRRDLRQVLGEENPCTDSPGEYKKLVNQHMFGFRKLEQYEQFIRLLVKVRAPKLSKEFRPSRVYEILNDSLQTLTDEDLRVMVDAMEKMDEIQESLETLERAFEDVKVIRTEYTRYNQYMLAKKGQAYLERRREVHTARAQMEQLTRRKQEISGAMQENQQKLSQHSGREKVLLAEREGLLDTDLEDADRRLEEARKKAAELQEREQEWQRHADDANSRIFLHEQKLKSLEEELEGCREQLQEQKEELAEQQEILLFGDHDQALGALEQEQTGETGRIAASLAEYGKQLAACRKVIRLYEEAMRQYDEEARRLEALAREKAELEEMQEAARNWAQMCREDWIEEVFETAKQADVWKPERQVLLDAEEKMQDYQAVSDAGAIQELLRLDYERQRQELLARRREKQYQRQEKETEFQELSEELTKLRQQEELEPERDEPARRTREALCAAGIQAVPFYKTIEFDPQLEESACAALEAQLQRMGLLDALVIAREDLPRIRKECPEFLDSLLLANPDAGLEGNLSFPGLTVNEQLPEGIRRETERILKSIAFSDGVSVTARGNSFGVTDRERVFGAAVIGRDGSFCHGLLAGKAAKAGEAEFVGQLARQRRKEQKIRSLEEQVKNVQAILLHLEKELELLEDEIGVLEAEYRGLPDFSELNDALQSLQELGVKLEIAQKNMAEQEKKERESMARRDTCYQEMLRQCRPFPYGRTEAEYEEAAAALEEYENIWQTCRELLARMERNRESITDQRERMEREEESQDHALTEKRRCTVERTACQVQIRQYEEYLNRPEIREQAKRLEELNTELAALRREGERLRIEIAKQEKDLELQEKEEPRLRESLVQLIGEETVLRRCFEEELSLKLLMNRESQSLEECAEKALKFLRDSDKNRESSELLQSLFQVFQKHNGSLASYGTALEECFREPVSGAAALDASQGEPETVSGVLRKRVLVVSVWNGKKVYLEEFYQILRNAIDETRLLIQEKDRELFEDILSQTISQQLTDRIAESRKWVEDMSKLMREMDTSMGLSFSLEWKPKKAENDAELDATELEQILLRDRELLTDEDIEKAASHFRSKIRTEKLLLQENGGIINYMDLVREAMDYRGWFEFRMYYRRGEEPRKPLTNAAFNRFSGGEKAMAMYVPLFAAVNAQYKKAERRDHPRMIALDEAFAGVDDKNISSMFALVHKLDFDYIMNSQALWGCFDTVDGLRIAELQRPMNSQIVTVIRYTWNGHERILEEQ